MKHTVKVEKTDQIYKSGNSILNNAKYSSDNTDEWYKKPVKCISYGWKVRTMI